MKSGFFLTLLPALAVASTSNSSFSDQNPQQGQRPSAQYPWPVNSGRNCANVCDNALVACKGKTLCECENHASILCFQSLSGKCSLQLEACALPKGQATSDPEYPPCGKSLPGCSEGRTCHPLARGCGDSCLGMCIPNLPPPPPKAIPTPKAQNQPTKGQPQPGPPKGGQPGPRPQGGQPPFGPPPNWQQPPAAAPAGFPAGPATGALPPAPAPPKAAPQAPSA